MDRPPVRLAQGAAASRSPRRTRSAARPGRAGARVRQPEQQVGQAVGLDLLAAGVEPDRRGRVGMSREVRRLVPAIVSNARTSSNSEAPHPTDRSGTGSRSARSSGSRVRARPTTSAMPASTASRLRGSRPARSTPTPHGVEVADLQQIAHVADHPSSLMPQDQRACSSRRPPTRPARCRAPRMRGRGARSARDRRRLHAGGGQRLEVGGGPARIGEREGPGGLEREHPDPLLRVSGRGGRTRAPSSRGSRPRSAGSRGSIPAIAAGRRPPARRGRPRAAGPRAARRRGAGPPPGSTATRGPRRRFGRTRRPAPRGRRSVRGRSPRTGALLPRIARPCG